MTDFETWWNETGQETLYALNTLTDADAKVLAEIAWESALETANQEPVAVVEITYGREPECYVTGNIDDFPEGVFKLYAAPQPVITPDVCGEVCVRAKLCYGCGKALDEANAEHERKYGILAGTHNWTPPNYTDEQWQKLDQEYQDHVAEQEPYAYEVWDANDQVLILIYASCLKEFYWIEQDDIARKLYADPVRTKDLTDDEIWEALETHSSDIVKAVRAAIAKFKEKNK